MAPPKTPQPPFDSQLILDREKWPMKPGEFTVSICKMCCIYMYLRTRRKILEQESVSLFSRLYTKDSICHVIGYI